MPKVSSRAAFLAGSADDVEAAFYEALQTGNTEQLMACWAHEDEVVCVHPGGGRLVGLAAIRASFEAMFANGVIRAWPERVRRIDTMTSAVRHVLERIEVRTEQGAREALVIATNVYHKTTDGWKMVVHHASPATESELQEVMQTQVLH
ncbi:MAG: DUF4440 domain-containing protein [Betaproteobacteria bacterium]|jgi:uncharacterized protein (TIGR02246 family)|nr:DUF4440 domain-containing protein [Betaproteobacteria bacterium]NBS47807.1 DUF4440 domain-containing protein [Betaproteobacteria bacterium]